MTDDPREILKAAGEECAEVQAFMDAYARHGWQSEAEADAAILALARLASKYKWLMEYVMMDEGWPEWKVCQALEMWDEDN